MLREVVRRVASIAVALTLTGCSGTAIPSASPSPPSPATPAPATPSATPPPSPSPDDTTVAAGEPWIVYQWIDDTGDGLFLIRPDGSGRHQLVPDLLGSERHPDWSPDGRRISFIHQNEEDRSELWTVGADGADPERLAVCDLPCNEWNYPDWAPDGSAIYIGTSSHASGGPPTTFGVDRVEVPGGSVTTVLERTDGLTAEQPRVSPDGTLVAYARGDIVDTSKGFAIYIADLQGGPERALTDAADGGGHPDWTPDGRIVFDTFDLNFYPDTNEPSNLYSMAADGSGLMALTTKGPHDRATQPRVTPDGTSITYTRVTGAGTGVRQLAVMALDGTDDRFVPDPPVPGTHGQWRPLP